MKWFEQNNCKSQRLDFAYSMSDRLSSHNPTCVGKEETNSLHRLNTTQPGFWFSFGHTHKSNTLIKAYQEMRRHLKGWPTSYSYQYYLEWFPFEYRKVICFASLRCGIDFKTVTSSNQNKAKTFRDSSAHGFPRFSSATVLLILIGSFWFNLAPRVDRTLGTRLTWSYNTSLKTENFRLSFQAFYCGGCKTKRLFERRGTEKEVSEVGSGSCPEIRSFCFCFVFFGCDLDWSKYIKDIYL